MSKRKIRLEGTKIDKLYIQKYLKISDVENPKKQSSCYKCICDCGATCFIRPSLLIDRVTANCGNCTSQLVGKKIGKLLVVEKLYSKNAVYFYKCLCECGGEGVFSSKSLGKRKSCGCLAKEKLPEGESTLNSVIKGYKAGCIDRGLEYCLSRDEFKNLCFANCFYCDKPPANTRNIKGKKFIYNGIDRLDASIGYIYSNCVTCCWVCNRMKHKMSVKEFLQHISKILINSKDLIK